MDQPGKVANPARGQLNRENEHSPVPVRARILCTNDLLIVLHLLGIFIFIFIFGEPV